ncbi:putative protein tyrosine kinase [Tieghemostelium lacteum]|uniref:Protein kinase domain-containing protein n=1 Tax=Tieghemostelium lacteum TaxID=361077 RepID=A0A151ZJY9_TIELA|nr:putative protein tyrosine kinase [Tieghemostelium lacteum]|eukprot:KYQ94312.1 putative protein tyrosine kinase [Tieghemostelium lacteum]
MNPIIPSTPLKTPLRNGYGGSSDSSKSLYSNSKPTPEQYVFDVQLFSEKKRNPNQTPRCPSPPFKSTPASRIYTNTPIIHHLSTLATLQLLDDDDDDDDEPSFLSKNKYNKNSNTSSATIDEQGTEDELNFSALSANSLTSLKREPVTLFDKNFDILNKLGSGSFSDVFRTRSKIDGKLYAIKQARHQYRGLQERERSIREVKTSTMITPHPNIVQYYSAWEQSGYLYIQTELCQNGSLKDFLETEPNLEEELIWSFLLDTCLGVQHIHSFNLLHLDIKPENLLISSQGTLKIGDFGMCVKLEHHSLHHSSNNNHDQMDIEQKYNNNSSNSSDQRNNNNIEDDDDNNLSLDEDDIFFDFMEGDSRYLAIEFLNDKKLISKPSDIFSVGVTFFEIITGKEMPSNGPLWEQIRSTRVTEFLENNQYSQSLCSVIVDMLKPNITDRLTLCSLFKNPNIQQIQHKRLQDPNYSLNLILKYFNNQKQQQQQNSNKNNNNNLFNNFLQQESISSSTSSNNLLNSFNNISTNSSSSQDDENSGRESPVPSLIFPSINNSIKYNNNDLFNNSHPLSTPFVKSQQKQYHNNQLNSLVHYSNNLSTSGEYIGVGVQPPLLPPQALNTINEINPNIPQSSNVKKLGKRGFIESVGEDPDSKNTGSSQKVFAVSRRGFSETQEDVTLSPRNLLSLFQQTKQENK